MHTTRDIYSTSGRRAEQTHTGAQTHACAVILTGCDSEESVPNVLLLDNLKGDGKVNRTQ